MYKVILFVFLFILYSVIINRYSPEVRAQQSDVSPNSELEVCDGESARTGSPIDCQVGEFKGHSYLRYVGRDSSDQLLCQRSFCLDDTNFTPFETVCSSDEANSGSPLACTVKQNGKDIPGFSYARYSFTDLNGQAYCFRSSCVADPNALPVTPATPLPQTPNASPNGQTIEENAVSRLNKAILPTDAIREKPDDRNVLEKVAGVAGDAIRRLFGFLEPPNYPARVYSESNSLGGAKSPIGGNGTGSDPAKETRENLQIYYGNIEMPKFDNVDQSKIGPSEKNYVKANFPEGIDPITPPNK